MLNWKHGIWFVLALIGVGVGACESGGSDFQQQCVDDTAAPDYAGACKCLVQNGAYADENECTTDLQMNADTLDASCACAEYDADADLKAYYECFKPYGTKYDACVKAANCDADAESACLEELNEAFTKCTIPDESKLDAVEAKCSGAQ